MIHLVRLILDAWRSPAWVVVPADVDAAAACAVLHAAAFARGWTREEFESLLTDRSVLAEMLVDRRRPRRGAAGFILSRFAADEAEICSVAVSPRQRHRGGGAAMLRTHLNSLAGHGVRRVTLEVDLGNAPARRLYHRLGFTEVGRRAGYYRTGDDATTALILARQVELAPRLHPEAFVS